MCSRGAWLSVTRCAQVLHDENNNVIGVATNDMGISKSGDVKDSFAR
jgi:hypothetical protein